MGDTYRTEPHFGGSILTDGACRNLLIQPGEDAEAFADEVEACHTLADFFRMVGGYFDALPEEIALLQTRIGA